MPDAERQETSPKRQSEPWRVLARTHPRGRVLPLHQHGHGQLLFALSGVMLVDTPGRRWTVPPQHALWIPPQQPHSIRMLSTTALRTVYLSPTLVARCAGFARRAEVHAVDASPLLRELLLCLFDAGHDAALHGAAARLLLQALRASARLPSELPMPVDPALRGVADALLDERHWGRTLADCAAAAAMSERSFSRRFTADVGLSFRAWRQRARVVASLDALAQGRPVKQIAARLGFASAAAYSTAFRAVMHAAPKAFGRAGGSTTAA